MFSYHRLELVKIIGKRSRIVPVLLPPDLQEGLQCILTHRTKYIGDAGPYLFATNKTGRSVTGWEALKAVVKQVPEVEKPENITSTKLRKYLATMSQVK